MTNYFVLTGHIPDQTCTPKRSLSVSFGDTNASLELSERISDLCRNTRLLTMDSSNPYSKFSGRIYDQNNTAPFVLNLDGIFFDSTQLISAPGAKYDATLEIEHPNLPWLGVSPDGITDDGIMLEIKCPSSRQITGEIPSYYWCQVQQQLECLDLDECDFIQCNIERYGGREDWLADTHPECDFRSIKYGNLRGVVIELIPTKLLECDYNEKGYLADMTIWTKTKCLFPPKIDMSLKELDDWILEELSKLPWGYSLHNVIYWRLIEQNCTLILREREWFKSQLPTYNKIWGYVEYLRANLDVCEKWKEWIDAQPRKYNDKVIHQSKLLNYFAEKKEISKSKKIGKGGKALINKIKLQIKKNASPRHVPSKIIVVKDIPRTKSGKIVELAVKSKIEGSQIKNIEALANPEALEQFNNLKELSN